MRIQRRIENAHYLQTSIFRRTTQALRAWGKLGQVGGFTEWSPSVKLES